MSVITRVRNALGALRGGDGVAQLQRSGRQTALVMWPQNQLGRPQWEIMDLQSYIDSGFSLNSVIYSAIMYKVRAMSSAPLRAYRGTVEQSTLAPATDPLAALLMQPNRFQSALAFHSLNIVYFNLAGNAYIYLRRTGGDLPEELFPLRPDWVKIVPSLEREQPVVGYLYVPEGKSLTDGYPILPEDLIHVKLPNPGDPLSGAGYGLSPLSPLAQSANVDNDVTKFLKVFFQSGAMFQHALSFDMPLSEDQAAAARAKFEAIYGGAENWNKIAIIERGGKLQRLSPTFDEMGFEKIDARNETRMLGPFGVPPILTGTRVGLERSTFANYEEARRACWEDTLLPELRLFESAYRQFLAVDGGMVSFDVSDVPALRRDLGAITEAAYKLWAMGTPAQQAFAAVGLNVPEFDGWDVSYLPTTVLPAGAPRPSTAPIPVVRSRKARYDAKAMQVKLDTLAVDWEQRFGETAATLFAEEARELRAMIDDLGRGALARKGAPDWRALIGSVLDWYTRERPEAWRSAFVPLLDGLIAETGREWAATLGLEWTVRSLRGEAWFEQYTLVFANPITETSREAVHGVLEQTLAEGWSIPQTQDRLGLLFEQLRTGGLSDEDFAWMEARLPPYRRETIARTETIRAEGAGAYHLGQDWGVERKAWLPTSDGRTRETHVEAGQKYGEDGSPGPIPLDSPFYIGSYAMQYPGDPAGGVEEFANCRCTLLLLKD